jgi:hypothetical protein
MGRTRSTTLAKLDQSILTQVIPRLVTAAVPCVLHHMHGGIVVDIVIDLMNHSVMATEFRTVRLTVWYATKSMCKTAGECRYHWRP